MSETRRNCTRKGVHHETESLEPQFRGHVLDSPEIADGSTKRELCDVLAYQRCAFVFQAKAFSVFDKPLDQTPLRKTNTVLKHFRKAFRQLQGAIKCLDGGCRLWIDDKIADEPKAAQFKTIHGIALVSNTSFALPWAEIGEALANAGSPPRVYFHFFHSWSSKGSWRSLWGRKTS
jgi:hypothetical protein